MLKSKRFSRRGLATFMAIVFIIGILPTGIASGTETIYLSSTGWSNPNVGTWDPATQTGMLTADLTQPIEITSDNITLNGDGHSLSGSGTGNGIYLYQRTGVTVKNVTVTGFWNGIYLNGSNSNTLTSNTATRNTYGISLNGSDDNTVKTNSANQNYIVTDEYSGDGAGIYLVNSSNTQLDDNQAILNHMGIAVNGGSGNIISENTVNSNNAAWGGSGIVVHSSNNTLTNNTANDSSLIGILLGDSANNNTLTGNTANSNQVGIRIGGSYSASGNTLTANTANSNQVGIKLVGFDNIITGNTLDLNVNSGIEIIGRGNAITGNLVSSSVLGISLFGSQTRNNILSNNTLSLNEKGVSLTFVVDNQIYNNNFLNNTTQAYVQSSTGNVFSKPAPIGGNYWSNWTGPDSDSDGFVDNPYVFTGGQDDLPWALPDGWLDTAPPTTTSEVTVALPATDNEGGTGVSNTEYSYDGTTWITYTGPITISAEGTTTVYYRSIDRVGNVEPTRQLVISR